MFKNIALYRASSWLKHFFSAWNTGGEGIHSPYLFEWVRMIQSDSHAYYKWSDIERVREEMLHSREKVCYVDYGSGASIYGEKSMRTVCDIAKSSLEEKKYAQMLYRLVNWLTHQRLVAQVDSSDKKGLHIMELGTSLGITTAYLASVNSHSLVETYEGCDAVAEIAKANWNKLGISNIQCHVGEITEAKLRLSNEMLDVVFIDANHTYDATLLYFETLVNRMHAKSVMVVDDIHYSEEMEKAWTYIQRHAVVSSTIDLYKMGLVFFDTHYLRRNYKMRF